MRKVYKPKQPLIKDGGYLFPLTTADQVYHDAPGGKMLDAKIIEMDEATERAERTMAAMQETTDTAAAVAAAAHEKANAATTYSTAAATLEAANTTGGTVTCLRYGRLVMVHVNQLGLKISAINGTTWARYTVATGLPAPAVVTPYEQLAIECRQSEAGRFRVTADGQLEYYHEDQDLIRGGKADTAEVSGVITYIAAE